MANRVSKETMISRIMEGLQCSEQEAEEVYNYDKAVDHDQKTEFDATPEQLKVERQMARTGTRKTPTVYNWTKPRAKKVNATREGLKDELVQLLTEKSSFAVENLQIPEKESNKITFQIGEKWYTTTITAHRDKPKWAK